MDSCQSHLHLSCSKTFANFRKSYLKNFSQDEQAVLRFPYENDYITYNIAVSDTHAVFKWPLKFRGNNLWLALSDL